MLIFANKTKSDIILEGELRSLLGNSFINILSSEKAEGYKHGFITEEFLKSNIPQRTKNYYLCGPPAMMESVLKQLSNLGVGESSVTMEKM